MSTITNVALNFTKEELIARLRAVLPIAKERDKKAVAEHRAAERAYLDGWRDRLRECLKWGYKTAKESYFNIGGDFGRWGAPSCPEPLVEKIESAIAMVEMSNQSKYTLRDVELTPTGGVVEWPAGFFDQGPDEAHQLLIAAAERQRSRKV